MRGRKEEFSNSRRLLRRLIEVVAEPIAPQQRLDRIVSMIAANIVAEVCSVYALRAGDILELFATEGLAKEAVHSVRMRVGEGLVGWIAAQGSVINTTDARNHPNFRYFPETKEELYRSFLGVPIQRGGKVVGVLTVQNSASRHYGEEEIEALQIIGSVLAEMFNSGDLIDSQRYSDLRTIGRQPLRIEGTRLVEGLGIGRAVLHEPQIAITRLISDNPAQERQRLEAAIEAMRRSLDVMLERADLGMGEHREILEAYRMFANDSGWLRRIEEAIETGLSAEAAVRRIQDETRLRMSHASVPYLRERLLDLDELANRLLRHLVDAEATMPAAADLPPDVILIARNLTATELIEYDRSRLRGVVLEEGSRTAHVTIVARAFDIPIVGRIETAMASVDAGDTIALDAENGVVFIRPSEEVLQAFAQTVQHHVARRRELAALRDLPSTTRDGIDITLSINAAFLADMAMLPQSGALGVGLYRTELAFMSMPGAPGVDLQSQLYRQVLELAGGQEVIFRTLDIGSDKQVPFWRMPAEENPAMGWRALRMTLDRPAVLRGQLRALLRAAERRSLSVMFPMVAEVAEFDAAKTLIEQEVERARRRGQELPATIRLGVMLEVPSLFWQFEALLGRVDFISIGSNDLAQFMFACDRGHPVVADRYDVLSPGFLTFLRGVVEKCRAAGVRLALCGDMAGRPLEAMALVALGFRQLSLAGSDIPPVKAMIRSLEAGKLSDYLLRLINFPDRSLRGHLRNWAQDHAIVLPPGVYRPF